jgi:hypothetical protein
MQIHPTQPFIRIASLVACRYQDQIRRDSEVTLGQQFAAHDHGLAPRTTSVFGGGLPLTVIPDRDDPLEQLWHLHARQGQKIGTKPDDDPTYGRTVVSWASARMGRTTPRRNQSRPQVTPA